LATIIVGIWVFKEEELRIFLGKFGKGPLGEFNFPLLAQFKAFWEGNLPLLGCKPGFFGI